MTKSQQIAADVAALLRSRAPLLWIVTREEARVERYLVEAGGAAGYEPRTWDVAQGVAKVGETPKQSDYQDPGEALKLIATYAQQARPGEKPTRTMWILRDLPVWLAGPPGAGPTRQLRNLARSLPSTPRERAQAIVVITPSKDIPPELAGHATVIEWPLPDREEIAASLDAAIDALPDDLKAGAAPNGTREEAIDAAVGLTGEEAAGCYARSLVQLKRIDPATVAKEKRRVIARERVLEWYDPIPGGLNAVGGLVNLKAWLLLRAEAYTAKAREYGLPMPKGAMLVGVPGCGKSLTAKAIATAWGVPLLRVDLGGLKSKFVGESEANLRKAFDVIEAIGRCVVWFDEIEKALAGATQGAADGGVSSDALGSILSWMQERQGQAFVIATANDVAGLPPELLRKGRFDELWFVDLPTPAERKAVLATALKAHGRGALEWSNEDVAKIVDATDGFSGAEITALIPDALYAAFGQDREVTALDVWAAALSVTPLSKTAAEKINNLRAWAKGKARPANVAEQTVATESAVRLDI
jgi:MoxR-like ATPase